MHNELSTIEFSDIYLGKDHSFFAGVPGKLDPVPTPPSCQGELSTLRDMCETAMVENVKDDFTVRLNEVVYRASVLLSLNEQVFVLRRFPKKVPELSSLGLHNGYVKRFMQPKLTGLIVIAGAFGQGKTTTASSIVAARISQFGGVAVTIEDPPEMPLEGNHGEGVCYQTWVRQGGFGQGCRQAARWAPSIIFLGEVRDSESASEALRASINGRLVICTTHADSVSMAVERLYSLANGVAGSADDVAGLLGSGLTAVAHQELLPDATGAKRLKMQLLWLGDEDAKGVRNNIRQRRFDQIDGDIQLQLNRMLIKRTG